MKMMKLFGVVLAFHVVLISVVLMIQGCRSTPAPTPPPPEYDTTAAPAPEAENWSSQGSTYNQPVAPGYTAPTPSAPALSGLTPAERARGTPTPPANPSDFIIPMTGATADAPPAPAPTSHVVRAGDSLWEIAAMYRIGLPELRRANPNLRGDSIRPGQTLQLPPTAVAPGTGAPPPPSAAVTSGAATSTYTVRAGDSLSKIAARNGTTVTAIKEANNLRSNTIHPGQVLKIPAATLTAPERVAAGSTQPSPSAPPTGAVTITVQRGDTLGEIARKVDVTVAELKQANNLTSDTIRIGDVLVIPGYEAVGAGTISRTPPPAGPSPAPRPPADTTPLAPPPTDPGPPPLETLPPADPSIAPPVVPIDEPTPTP